MDKNNEEKTCGNCKYFTRYYTKSKIWLRATVFGQCFLKKIRSKTSTVNESAKGCAKWEQAEDYNIMLNIDEVLRQTAKRIDDIAYILNELK